ncbi:MAG: glutamyl-tRNA reductase [Deltaproteobacteria bacterium]|nr:glutamyl-tRNA reductase [Deltaproteobacteria bacterium]
MIGLCCWGVSFRTATVAEREGLIWPRADRIAFVADCCAQSGLREALLVQTCNRSELYVVATSSAAEIFQTMTEILSRQGQAMVQCWQTRGYRYAGEVAVRHLFRVAASLDAMIVGEAQILGQLKAAYAEAVEAGSIGPVLHRLCQRAFASAKRVRERTGIGQHPISAGSVAVELASQLFGDLAGCRTLIVGRGEIGQQILRQLWSRGVRETIVIGRTQRPDVGRALSGCDIALAAAAAEALIIDTIMVREVMARRRQPLFLLDLGMPRNIDSEVAKFSDVYLYDLDDLRSVAEQNLAARRAELTVAEEMVENAAIRQAQEITERFLLPQTTAM